MATQSVQIQGGEPWIAVDWGTSRLRAWLVHDEHTSQPIVANGPGMNQLAPDQFENTLLDAIRTHLPPNGHINIIACGMVGAKQGWVEAPYRATPCNPISGDQFKTCTHQF